MRKRRFLSFFCAATFLAVFGCSQTPASDPEAPYVLPVSVIAPAIGNLEQKTSYIGKVYPALSVHVFPMVGGEVIAVHANAGDVVKAGDLLFEVDSTEIKLTIRQAEAGIDVIRANIALSSGTSYEAQMLSATNALEQAQSNKKWTQDTYDNYDKTFDATRRTLYNSKQRAASAMTASKTYYENMRTAEAAGTAFTFADGTVAIPTRAEVDAAQATYLASQTASQTASNAYEQYKDSYESQYNQLKMTLDQAQLGLNAAQQSYDLVSSGRALQEQTAVLQAQIKQAQAGAEVARQKLSYAQVTSPIDGIVEQKNVSLYNMASPSSPAFVISRFDAMEVAFSVSAQTAGQLGLGDAVAVEYGKIRTNAHISEIATSASSTTGLILVKAELPQGQSPPSGVSVKVTVVSSKDQNAVLIPVKCLYYDDGLPYVYIVSDGTARVREVTTGIIALETVAILDGLSVADRVITTWNPNLANGLQVAVVGEG